VADAGVVVQDVDAAAVIEDGPGKRLDLLGPAHVDRVIGCAATDLARYCGDRLGVDVGDMDLGALVGEQPRGRRADSRAGARDDRGLHHPVTQVTSAGGSGGSGSFPSFDDAARTGSVDLQVDGQTPHLGAILACNRGDTATDMSTITADSGTNEQVDDPSNSVVLKYDITRQRVGMIEINSPRAQSEYVFYATMAGDATMTANGDAPAESESRPGR
jgi:hypothetical protein